MPEYFLCLQVKILKTCKLSTLVSEVAAASAEGGDTRGTGLPRSYESSERYRPPCDTELAAFDDSLQRILCLLRSRVDSKIPVN